ncbi:glycoside hydrolase family 28 protein [Carboxylicivirga caseinilyticus]|uniref:glycoside hydrolase family 28 protein n=1 Tax=Carboxylicivirga caseinilyticus TaxID=3417572 RepID=UPI003D329A84|nr:glycoside hydrolase family 28 protein [Marinilabiliaceae bacterium A049]
MKSFVKISVFVTTTMFLLGLSSCLNNDQNIQIKSIKPDAPFDMPAITYPDFSKAERIEITKYGAVAGDIEKTSEAIELAIEEASLKGGSVIVPEGEWLTRSIHLMSNVNLHLEKGAVLLFSEKPEDYLPAVHTSWEGMECYNYSPLVYAYECKNVAITGEGELKAKLDTWKVWYKRPAAHMNSLKWLYMKAAEYSPVEERVMVNDTSNLRPHFIQFNRCENVLMEGVKVTNSPFWTIHPYLCKNVVIRNVQVYAHGHNNDGVDPEMTQNMLVENCYFDQGDDAFAIKSGRNQDAWRLDTPTKNLVIKNCHIKNGHQLLAIGSELSGGIENVFLDSCTVEDGANMFHLVFIKTNERRGGYVKNIHVSNVKADKMREGILGIETDVLYQWRNLVPTIERRLTPVSDVYLKNIEANNVKFISRVLAQEEMPVSNVQLISVVADTLRSDQQHIHENLIGFKEIN